MITLVNWTNIAGSNPDKTRITLKDFKTMLGINTEEVYNGLEKAFSETADILTRVRSERQTWKDMAEKRGRQIHELIQERDTLKDAYIQASLANRSGSDHHIT
jgi:hypothetical protein